MGGAMSRVVAILSGVALLVVFGVLLALPRLLPSVENGATAYGRQDYATAFREFLPLANKGDATAQFFIGEMYRLGQGVKQDNGTAAKWHLKAAIEGNSNSQFTIGMMYAHGMGVEKDFIQAYKWCSLAIIRLSPWDDLIRERASQTRAEILTVMPQSDVDKAKALVIEWDRKFKSR
jgi:hypothetical protein